VILATLFASVLLLAGQDEANDLERRAAECVERSPVQAVELMRRVVTLRTDSAADEPLPYARALNGLAFALSRAGEHDEAIAFGERALTELAETRPSPMGAAVLRNLAEICERAQRLDLARDYAEQAVTDAELSTGRTPDCADNHEYAGQLALRAGDTTGAIEHYTWALAIQEKYFGPDQPGMTSDALHGLALALRFQGRVTAGLVLNARAQASLEAHDQVGTPAWSAHVESRITALEELGELEQAAALFGRWVSLRVAQLPAEGSAVALEAWASRWLGYGRPGEARELLARVPADERGSFEHQLVAAEVALQTGRDAEALEHLEQAQAALSVSGPNRGRPVAPELEWLRARALRALGRQDASQEGPLELLQLEREEWGELSSRLVPTFLELVATEVATPEVSPELIDGLQMLDVTLALVPPEDLVRLQDFARVRDGHSPWEPVVRGWQRLVRHDPKRLDAALVALDRLRERELLSVHGIWAARGAARSDGDLARLLSTLRARQTTRLPAELEEPEVREQAYRTWLAELAEDIERFDGSGSDWRSAAAPAGVDPARLRARLRERGETLLLLSWTARGIDALVVPAEGEVLARSLEGSQELVLAALAGLRDPSVVPDLGPLGERLLTPLWGALSEAASVVVAADGPLAFLPLEALPTPAGDLWVERCRVTYAPTLARWCERRIPTGAERRVGHLVAGGRAPTSPRFEQTLARAGPAIVVERRGLARSLPEEEPTWSLEDGLVTASVAGELRELGLLEVHVPVYVDALVPSATGLSLGASPQTERSLWERADGWLDPVELRALALDAEVVGLWSARTVGPLDGAARAAGLHDLVAGLWDAGAGVVLVSGWEDLLDDGFPFANLLGSELARDDPAFALVRAQRKWLERAKELPRLADPSIWARLRTFGG